MAGHDHNHEEHATHDSELSEAQLRVRALETLLTEKGYVHPAALDAIIEDRSLRDQDGPAQSRPCRRPGVDGSRVQEGAARRRVEGGRHARPCQPELSSKVVACLFAQACRSTN